MQSVQTFDGSPTLYNDRYGEHLHSVKEGALKESFFKHVRPAIAHSNAMKKESISVLDICFGLGYNSLCLIDELNRDNYGGKIDIVSLEIDRDLLKSLDHFDYPIELKKYSAIVHSIAKNFSYKDEKISIDVIVEYAEKEVKKLTQKFDIIFQDPFSIMKNPELWSEEWFSDLYAILREDGVITTYSASANTQKNMKAAGFFIHSHNFPAKSGLRNGTIAAKIDLGHIVPHQTKKE